MVMDLLVLIIVHTFFIKVDMQQNHARLVKSYAAIVSSLDGADCI